MTRDTKSWCQSLEIAGHQFLRQGHYPQFIYYYLNEKQIIGLKILINYFILIKNLFNLVLSLLFEDLLNFLQNYFAFFNLCSLCYFAVYEICLQFVSFNLCCQDKILIFLIAYVYKVLLNNNKTKNLIMEFFQDFDFIDYYHPLLFLYFFQNSLYFC